MHLILGKTKEEWEQTCENCDDLWDFPIEELLDGTVDINEDIWYYLINGRLYESEEQVV